MGWPRLRGMLRRLLPRLGRRQQRQCPAPRMTLQPRAKNCPGPRPTPARRRARAAGGSDASIGLTSSAAALEKRLPVPGLRAPPESGEKAPQETGLAPSASRGCSCPRGPLRGPPRILRARQEQHSSNKRKNARGSRFSRACAQEPHQGCSPPLAWHSLSPETLPRVRLSRASRQGWRGGRGGGWRVARCMSRCW